MTSDPLQSWDALTAWGTVALGIATVFLVIVGAVAAVAAINQVKAARREFAAALSSQDAARKAVVADHLRRRGEATMAAIERFEATYSEQHDVILKTARSEGKTVKVLLTSGLKGEVQDALQKQLDALEMLSLGARMEIFDVNVIGQAARSIIRQLWERSTGYRSDLNNGRLDSRPAQPTAYEHSRWLHDKIEEKNGPGPIHLDGTLPSLS